MDNLFFNRHRQDQSLEELLQTHETRPSSGSHRSDLTLRELIPHRTEIWSALQTELAQRTYAPQPGRIVSVFADKPRKIVSFDWIDRLILDHFARTLAKVVEPQLSDNLWSFRKGRGQHEALQRVVAYIQKQPIGSPIYVLRRDIREFGDSLKHEFLLQDFKELAHPSSTLIFLLEQICRYQKINPDGSLETNRQGLPTGSYLQLVFENMYLLNLDRALEKIPDSLSMRFGDDILFLCTQENIFEEAKSLTSKMIQERNLDFNLEKSFDLKLEAQGKCRFFEYLGMRVWRDGRLSLPPRKTQLIRKILKSRMRNLAQLQRPLCQHTAELITRISMGMKGYLESSDFQERLWPYLREVSDENELRDLDRWLCLSLLQEVLQSGFSKANFRNYRPRDLRKRGLPSLLHIKRTQRHG